MASGGAEFVAGSGLGSPDSRYWFNSFWEKAFGANGGRPRSSWLIRAKSVGVRTTYGVSRMINSCLTVDWIL